MSEDRPYRNWSSELLLEQREIHLAESRRLKGKKPETVKKARKNADEFTAITRELKLRESESADTGGN